MKLTNAEIQKSIAELPDNIKQAVVTFDWATEILDIAHEHNMQIDDADDFRHQTLLVILGKTPAEDYEKNLVHELGLSPTTANSLVAEANTRIFIELQKRAFGKNVDSQNHNDNSAVVIASDSAAISDPYQEPIEHTKIKDVMSSQGIHLVDEHEPEIFDTDLHNEVSEILSGVDIKPHIELEPHFSSDSSDIASDAATTSETSNQTDKETHQGKKSDAYHEPIHDQDLTGIRTHEIDTSIIKKRSHNNPDDVFNNVTRKIPDLGQGDYQLPTLDKHILENPFSPKTNTITASPTENEQIKESGEFLEHLKTEV